MMVCKPMSPDFFAFVSIAEFYKVLCDNGWPSKIRVSPNSFWRIFMLLPPGERALRVEYIKEDGTATFHFFVMGMLTMVAMSEPIKRPSFVDFTENPPKVVF